MLKIKFKSFASKFTYLLNKEDSEPLNWQQENERIQLLFDKQEFIKTMVGGVL